MTDGTEEALIALADLEPDAAPETWPALNHQGRAAAALVTGHLDHVPDELGETWRVMPRALRALVRHRNPALAVYASRAAERA